MIPRFSELKERYLKSELHFAPPAKFVERVVRAFVWLDRISVAISLNL